MPIEQRRAASCVKSNRTPLQIVANCIARKQREHMNWKQTQQLVIKEWQQAWKHSTKGRGTHRIIPNIEEWINRKHGKLFLDAYDIWTRMFSGLSF